MPLELDHIMFGAADLDAGCDYIEALLGMRPVRGGEHLGLGTCNALLGLGSGRYLEVIAPIDGTVPADSFGEKLTSLGQPGIVTWVLRTHNLGRVAAAASDTSAGLVTLGPVPTERMTPEGNQLKWDLLFLSGHNHGGLLPFFIDWKDAPHPSPTSPEGGKFHTISLCSPHADTLNLIFSQLGIDMRVEKSLHDQISVTVTTASGEVTLSGTGETLALWGI